MTIYHDVWLPILQNFSDFNIDKFLFLLFDNEDVVIKGSIIRHLNEIALGI